MTPRRPAAPRMSTTSSADDGRSTSAADGEVRAQPVSSSDAIDAEPEQQHPGQAEQLDGAVGQDDLLGRPAPAGVDHQGVTQDGQHEGGYGQLEPQRHRPGGGRLLEGPQAVAGDGDGGGDRAHVAEVAEGVVAEDGPVAGPGLTELHVLGVALAADHEQGPEAGHDDEPVREGNAGGDAAGSSGLAWPSTPAAPGAANTSTFLIHCLGRAVWTRSTSKPPAAATPVRWGAVSSGSALASMCAPWDSNPEPAD